MQRLLSLALLLPTAAVAAATGTETFTTIRRLEDADYNMMNGYFKFSKCLRVKIAQDNDDDGNAYFYNGAYRSQSLAYAAYVKCEQGCGGTCDTSTAYVAELEGTMNVALPYAQGYCQQCASSCRRRRSMRYLEEEEQNYGYNGAYTVDCDTCSDECASMNGGGGNGGDESALLDCQYSYTDNDGLDYYSAPTCGSDGTLMMGLFYDNECTIKKTDDDSGFSDQFAYNSFHTVESVCIDCNDGVCDNIFNGATSCQDGRTANGENDDMGVCKAYKRMSKEWQYAKAKKKSQIPLLIFIMLVMGSGAFLAYTYYVRHKNANSSSTKTALLETEKDAASPPGGTPQGDYTHSP